LYHNQNIEITSVLHTACYKVSYTTVM